MTLKDHSAQAIFEALMLDPNLDISEGQTREEAAKQEAEYRARQHWNNMRALALGTTELDLEKSPLRALADFISRPQTFFTDWMPKLIKAKWSAVHHTTNWNKLDPAKKLHDDAVGDTTPEGEAFLKLLADNGASPLVLQHMRDVSKDYRKNDEDAASNPNGWIDMVSAALGNHSSYVKMMSDLGMPESVQKKISGVLHDNHYNAPAPSPKALTHNPDWLANGKYGSNTKKSLEESASLDAINTALGKMNRQERVELGNSHKLKFKDDAGNVQQWKAYKDAPEGQKRVRIYKNHVDSKFEGPSESPITATEVGDYTVAQILQGLFQHTDADFGQHDIDSKQAEQLKEIQTKHEDHLEQVDDSVDNVEEPPNLESVSEDEFHFVFGGKGGAKDASGKAMSEPWNHDTPIKLSYTGHHDPSGNFKAFHELAIEHGICDANGYMTHEHVANFKQACKDGVFDKSHVQKWTDDNTSSPTHGQTFYLIQHKKSANATTSGLHKYINHVKANPIIPPKAAAELAVEEPTKEAPEYGADTISSEDIKAALDKVGEEPPINHPDISVSEQSLLATQSKAIVAAAKEHYIVNPGTLHSMGHAVKGHAAVQNEAAKWETMAQDFVLNHAAVDNLKAHMTAMIKKEPGLMLPLTTHLGSLYPREYGDGALFNPEALKDDPDLGTSAQLVQSIQAYGTVLSKPSMMKAIEGSGGKNASQHFAAHIAGLMNHINNYCKTPEAANVHPMALVQMIENLGHDDDAQALAPFVANHFAGQSSLQHAVENPLSAGDAAAYYNGMHSDTFDMDIVNKELRTQPQALTPSQNYKPGSNTMNPMVQGEFNALLKNLLADAPGGSLATDDLKKFLDDNFLHNQGEEVKDDGMAEAIAQGKDNPQAMMDLYTNMVIASNDAAMEYFNEKNGEALKVDDLPISQRAKLSKLNALFQNQVVGDMTKHFGVSGDPVPFKLHDKMFAHEAMVSNAVSKIGSEGPLSLTGNDSAVMSSLAALGMHHPEMPQSEVDNLIESVKASYPEFVTQTSEPGQSMPEGLFDAYSEQVVHGAKNPKADWIEGSPLHNWELSKNEDGPYATQVKAAHVAEYEAAADLHLSYPNDNLAASQVKKAIGQAIASKAITHDDVAQSGISSAIVSDAISDHFGKPSQIETSVNSFSQAEDALVGASYNLNSAIAGGDSAEISNANYQLNQAKQNAQTHMDSQDIEDFVSNSLDDEASSYHLDKFGKYEPDGEFEDEYEEDDDYTAQTQADEAESQALDEKEQSQAYDDYHSALTAYDTAIEGGDADEIDSAETELYTVSDEVADILGGPLMGQMTQDALQPAALEQWSGEKEGPPDFEPDEDEDDQQENIDIELPDADLEDEEEPEVEEPPSVEDELDTVDDAADSIGRQKAEIMQEVFGRDQDSSDAKKYSKFLDKQKPEKIESLHEKHVIGNIEKKALKAKADKAKQKIQSQKDEEKAAAKEEADKAKAEEKQQKEEDKVSQKEADTLPHKASEIDKKIKEGQDAKQMARENMIHQHQHEDNMSPKTQKEYEEAFQKFEAAGVDMDELIDEKDKHGESYGSEEHLEASMKQDAKNDEFNKNYQDRISGGDYEQIQNRANSFRAGQPGKFTEFDEEGKPVKDLHTNVNKHGESSLSEHGHGEGPEAETKDAQGNDLKSHNIHHNLSDDDKKAIDAVKNYKEDSPIHQAAKKHLEDAGIDLKDVDGPSEDDVKSGPPDPEVARRKMAEGYVWHEETRHWILKDSLKDLQGGMGAHGAAMVHGNALMGKAGQMVKPFAAKEDGSAADSHFVAHQGGVHQVGTPNSKPGGASSHNHIQGAALGHALKDVQPGANGIAHLGNNALSPDGALGKVGLAQAGNHVPQFPQSKSPLAAMGGAMDKLKGMLSLEEIEAEKTAVEKLYVKYK